MKFLVDMNLSPSWVKYLPEPGSNQSTGLRSGPGALPMPN
jgi:predicted nuclease of predicted toxin-antitoxin system